MNSGVKRIIGGGIAVVSMVLYLYFQTGDSLDARAGARPEESFFLSRSYPLPVFPAAAYQKAVADAFTQSELRGSPVPGFDGDWKNAEAPNFTGRVNAVAVHPQKEQVLYAGLASGGVFKSEDGGLQWTPVFDNQKSLAIGALALEPGNPEVVYAGTGDPNVTGYPFLGSGLYRSQDGGKSWAYVGLQETQIISSILVHPTNPNILWVGCLGSPLHRHSNRGVYKSTDRGKTWKQVLFVSDQAGVTDMVLDPFNPNQLYAASWDRIRTNRESIAAGTGSAVFVSSDGGNTWNRPSINGASSNGRIALAHSGVTEGRVFARIIGADQELDNIYRSDDAGKTWTAVIDWATTNLSRTGAMGNSSFGWYFGRFAVHPTNDFEIYILGIDLWRTRNGGRNWELAAPSWRQYLVHADKHDLVFGAYGRMWLATDGGLYSRDETDENWTVLRGLPGLQFYRVGYNPHFPTIFYGGTQDNGTLRSNEQGANWIRMYPNDGFTCLFDPQDPKTQYVQMQYGRKFVSTNGGSTWLNASAGITASERTHWDTPFIFSWSVAQTMFTATYRVYKSAGTKIPSWQPISPDLTDGNLFGDAFHSVTCLASSGLDSSLLYAGTSDGNVWRTATGGSSWTPIQAGLPNRYVTSVHASPGIRDRVFVTFSGYRDNEALAYIFKSDNRGQTWENISGDMPPIAVNDLLVLPGRKDSVLFAATDAGVYGTRDGGKRWNKLGEKMPLLAIYDLEWNEAQHLLLAGSYGRGIFTYSLDYFFQAAPVSTSRTQPTFACTVYPNPTADWIYINWENNSTNPTAIRLFTANGSLCLQYPVAAGQQHAAFNLEALPAGTYQVQLQGAAGAHWSYPVIKF